MPRQARLDAPGTLHHVIVRGIEKRKIVDDRWGRGNFVSKMGQIASETDTVIYAWALMTNPPIFFYAVALVACQGSCAGFLLAMQSHITAVIATVIFSRTATNL
jgi:hypothetical protein